MTPERFGPFLAEMRKGKKMTQARLAEKVNVTVSAVSKWERGQCFPDISLLEPLAEAMGISVIELMSGIDITNLNRSSDMRRTLFYVCPICGNVIHSTGEVLVSCCGMTLKPLEVEEADVDHMIEIEPVENEYYVHVGHPMAKDHYISFIAAVSDRGVRLAKMYPEGNAEARFRRERMRYIYAYCNHHGLFRKDLRAGRNSI